MTPAPRTSVLIVASMVLLGGCGSISGLWTGLRSRTPDVSSRPVNDPPAEEARICQLARQAVREAMGVTDLRGESCTASHTRPGEWQARVEFASGTERHSYRLELQPHRDKRQGWGVVDITPLTPTG